MAEYYNKVWHDDAALRYIWIVMIKMVEEDLIPGWIGIMLCPVLEGRVRKIVLVVKEKKTGKRGERKNCNGRGEPCHYLRL